MEAIEAGLEEGWFESKELDKEARLLKVSLTIQRDHVD